MSKHNTKITCPKCGKVTNYLKRTDRINDKKQIIDCSCGHSEKLFRFMQQTAFERMFKRFKEIKPDTQRPNDLSAIIDMVQELSDEENELYFEKY